MKEEEIVKTYFNGIVAPILIPCAADGGMNEELLIRHLGFLSSAGVSGIFVGGTTGEFINFSAQERRRQLRLTCQHSSGMDVLYNITAMNCLELEEHIAFARSLGVECVSATAPYYHKYDGETMLEYFSLISRLTQDMALFVYNMPNMTGNAITPALLRRLRRACPNLKGIKDSSMNFSNLQELYLDAPEGFEVISGNDAEILPSLELGCKGSIVALANCFPELCVGTYQYLQSGQPAAARTCQNQLIRLRAACRGTLPVMSHKYLLELRGMPMGAAHFPMRELSGAEKAVLEEEYQSAAALLSTLFSHQQTHTKGE